MPLSSLSIAVAVAVPLLTILTYSSLTLLRRRRRHPPISNSFPLIGNLFGVLLNFPRFYDYVTDHFLSTSSLTIHVITFLHRSHFIASVDPKNLEHVLKINFRNYVKGFRFNDNLTDLLGDGIFNADGDLWSLQRKIASHEFNTRSLRSFIASSVQSEIDLRLIPFLEIVAEKGEIVDIQAVFQRFTFDNICNLAFGVDPACLDPDGAGKSSFGSDFAKAFDDASEICIFRLLNPIPAIWKVKRWMNVGSERRLREAVKVLDDYAMEIIRSKEEKMRMVDLNEDEEKMDLLSRFMRARIEEIEFGSQDDRRRFYRDVVISFILAGRDTTASALTWFFWLLSGHPRCERKIYDEISPSMASLTAGRGTPTYDDLKKFNYLHAALSESMRLFPPVPMNSRVAFNDDTFPDGTKVKKGWMADYSAYAMGRMDSVWGPDCLKFKPERWLDGNGEYRPFDQFKYPVFHCGPRICLGKEMAYVQMKSVAATVIYRFEIEAVDGGGSPERMGSPPYNVSLVMKMKGGLRVKLRRRV